MRDNLGDILYDRKSLITARAVAKNQATIFVVLHLGNEETVKHILIVVFVRKLLKKFLAFCLLCKFFCKLAKHRHTNAYETLHRHSRCQFSLESSIVTPLDDMLDKHFGKVGTPKRDAFESDVDEALHAYRLGEAVKKTRIEQNLTQEQLGELIGVKRAQKWHCGKTS